jgi:hypothetical protein
MSSSTGRTGPDDHVRSRYAAVSRRAFLRRVAGAGVAVMGVAACGHDDAAVFAEGGGSGGGPTSTAESTVPAAAEPTTTDEPTTTEAPAGVQGEMVVRFTYAAAASQRVRNPYIAVWIEDADGELVDTVALWFLQSQKGMRYLNELQRWSSVDGSSTTIDTVSSATRTPGDYALTWDLTDAAGRPVAAGDYHVCIEAAREHGPYSLVRGQVTLGDGDVTTELTPDGELSDATIDLVTG